MSAIAKVLLEIGVEVSGSDLKESRYTRSLAAQGARIAIGHDPANLPDTGVVVISTAIPEYNLELRAAFERGLTIAKRAQVLGEIVRRQDTSIAVGGTHGKTTTTSMIAHILDRAGLKPTFLIGGELNDIGSNAGYGAGKLCVVEADESDGSLVHLKPNIAVVTNIDHDHLDFHKSFANLCALFTKWLQDLPEGGKGVVYGDDSAAQAAAAASGRDYLTFGQDEDNDLRLLKMSLEGFGAVFEVASRESGEKVVVELAVPGEHNVQNAMAALIVAWEVGVDLPVAAASLKDFRGAQRRFQLVGEVGGVAVVDDYAHHPTEVVVTIDAASRSGHDRVICVFQPHRFSRTQMLAADFGAAFKDADLVVLTNIYNAGEQPIPGVSGKLIVDEILKTRSHIPVSYIPDKYELVDYLRGISRPGDLVLMMGAGDISGISHDFVAKLQGPAEL